jgi:shikimate dehydrogenase
VTDRYAVVGNPVAHSKSPFIHAQFARQTGEDIEYGRILAPLDGFRATVEAFRQSGGRGLNVTVPFKLEAYALATWHSEPALDAEAVNVLKFADERIEGYNTDGVGLVRDLESNLAFPIAGQRVLLMGAGGAAQGAIGPLLAAAPAALAIGNRTADKAQRLAERFARSGRFPRTRLTGSDYAALAGQAFDLIVNATSASLSGTLPALPSGVFAPGSLAYDMMYGKGLTPFLKLAQRQGVARLADGTGMLVEQAAESFLIWRGVRPRTDEVIAQLQSAQ